MLVHKFFCSLCPANIAPLSSTVPLRKVICIEKNPGSDPGIFVHKFFCYVSLVVRRVGNFRQKIIPRKTEKTEQSISSEGIPAVPRNGQLSKFCSKPFRRGEKCSEFSDENNLFAGAGFLIKLIFFMPFPSVPSLGIDSSVSLGTPRNKHFLPRNNGHHSESIPRNFFGTKFRC
jgi:hypothetical protein